MVLGGVRYGLLLFAGVLVAEVSSSGAISMAGGLGISLIISGG